MKDQFKKVIDTFKSYKIMVIGDAILDTYIIGITDRICREAPVPVINVQDQEHDCGGAANTAINVSNLGAETYFISVIGNDENGRQLSEALKKNKVNTDYVIQDASRTTIAKKRITAYSSILLRIDDGNTDPISTGLEEKLNQTIEKLYNEADAIILSDYGYGVITPAIIKKIEVLRAKNPKTLVVDSKDLSRFKSLKPTAVKPNYEEFLKLLNLSKTEDDKRVKQVLENTEDLFDKTGAECITQTLDVDGTVLLERGQDPFQILSVPQSPKNAIGAGDTFISALTLAFCSGSSPHVATEIAAAAAAIVLQKEGTVYCSLHDLKACFIGNNKYINSLEELKEKIEGLKQKGKKIVFTNGCFDILHKGHVTLLSKARELGEILIVGINSDDSIKRLKGSERPINSLEDRIEVLAGLYSVTYLISFEDDSPAELIEAIKPDVFVKGGDYTINTIPEALLVKQLGGDVITIPFVNDRSTTQLIKKIRWSA